ncbi:MAG: baseplate J/gp47 family protein [bacterium]|nr:baseplate J/gp47 family protein [bacterium]
MAEMNEKTARDLLSEVGITEQWANQELEAQITGGPLANLLQSAVEPVFELFRVVVSQAWALLYNALVALVPQLFWRTATGHWLDERAMDDGLSRKLGQRTQLTLDLTKAVGVPLAVDAGTVFFISEANPRRYQALAAVTPADGDSTFTVQVEALCPTAEDAYYPGQVLVYSVEYNAPLGMAWECEAALPLTSITYNGPDFDQTGEDPESDAALRLRIQNKRALVTINPGGVLYYTTQLGTVPSVAHVTHDLTGPDASMTFTIYGEGGELTVPTQEAAQALIDAEKMETDTVTVELATAEVLPLGLGYANAPHESALIQSVTDYFAQMRLGQDFKEGPLYAHLFAEFGLSYPDLVLELNTNSAVLPAGRYWVPDVTLAAL